MTADAKLVRGRWVVTGPGEADPTLTDGAVLIEEGRVLEVGDAETLRARRPEAEVLGGETSAVIPGLINAHHHALGVSYLQHGEPDRLLEPWILALWAIRASDPVLETLVSSARLLRSGVTTTLEVHRLAGTPQSAAALAEQKLAAYRQAGIRAVYAPGKVEQSHLVHGAGADQAFLKGLPADLRPLAERLLPRDESFDIADYLGIVEDLATRWRADPRVGVAFGPAGPQWVTDASWRRIAEESERLDLLIQTHVEESLYEKLHGPRDYGCPTVEHLHRLGLLGPRFSLAHGVWLSEPEIALLAETGAAVSHNPSSNLRLRAGIAPLNALLAAGVTVGLGLDVTALNDDEDMLTEMRLALRLHRTPELDGPAPSPEQVFALATTGGARLLRREGELGRLAPGMAADLVLLDLERLTWPWVAPEAEPRHLLLSRAQARDVTTVLVEGEVVLAEGLPTRFDLDDVGRELAAHLSAQPYPEATAQAVRKLLPHLEAFYRDWAVPAPAPFTAYNSRR